MIGVALHFAFFARRRSSHLQLVAEDVEFEEIENNKEYGNTETVEGLLRGQAQ